MWENKSSAGVDPLPFWIWWSLIYMLWSATFPLNMRINWLYTFSGGSSFYVAWVCNHCHWMSLNCCSKMGLMSHFPYFYDTFYFYRIYFSLMTSLMIISLVTSLTMMVLGLGYLVRAFFHFLKITFVVSVEYFHLVESMEYFHSVKSFEYFLLVKSNIVESNLVKSIEYSPLKKNPSFKLRIFSILSLCLCLAHSIHCNNRNTMASRKPVCLLSWQWRAANPQSLEIFRGRDYSRSPSSCLHRRQQLLQRLLPKPLYVWRSSYSHYFWP